MVTTCSHGMDAGKRAKAWQMANKCAKHQPATTHEQKQPHHRLLASSLLHLIGLRLARNVYRSAAEGRVFIPITTPSPPEVRKKIITSKKHFARPQASIVGIKIMPASPKNSASALERQHNIARAAVIVSFVLLVTRFYGAVGEYTLHLEVTAALTAL